MKIFTPNPIKALTLAICCLLALNVRATTYTAVASGWFTTTSTWQGGLVPAFNLNADTIVIPAGVTVKLNQSLMLTSPGALRINGVLSADTALTDVVLNSGYVDGAGTITVDSLEMDMTSGFNFTGTVNINKLGTTGTSLNSGATVNIAETIHARTGSLVVPSGVMNLANNVWVIFTGGLVDFSSFSNINVAGKFNVRYRLSANGSVTASELTRSELKDVEVHILAGVSLLLGGNLNLNGSLKLTSGILDLNGYDLVVKTDGYIAAGGTGLVSAAPPSSLILNSSNTSPGTLMFTAAGNTVKDLVVNMGNSFNDFFISSELNVAGSLTLQSGRLFLNNNELILAPAANIFIVNTGSPSYIVPGQNGSLRMTLTNGLPQTFYVGTANSFAPAMVMPNNVPSTGTVGVTVHPAVYVNSTSAEQIGSNQPVVNATWYVTGPPGSNINIDFMPIWSSSMEVNGFDRNMAYTGRYVQGMWDLTTATAATPMPNGFFSLRRNNIKGFGAFAVLDQRAKTTDIRMLASKNSFTLYPNPATSQLNVKLPDHVTNATGIIYDATGRMMKVFSVQTGAISIDDLPAGKYQLKISGRGFDAARSFLKL
jgi:hypothetical protein